MNDPDILKLVKEQEDYLIKMRRYFHMNPELSNKEFETRKTIISELEKMGVEYRLAGSNYKRWKTGKTSSAPLRYGRSSGKGRY
jgi:metal-dependent amidase/aminoacylase/carboxypeptidase family protein